jgi:hypothetical protein
MLREHLRPTTPVCIVNGNEPRNPTAPYPSPFQASVKLLRDAQGLNVTYQTRDGGFSEIATTDAIDYLLRPADSSSEVDSDR